MSDNQAVQAADVLATSFGENEVRFDLHTDVAPLDVIYQTCFRFIDRCYLYLDKPAEEKVQVVMRGKESLEQDGLVALQGEFSNELINQQIRKQVAEQNKTLRELILSKALFANRPAEYQQIQDGLGPDTPSGGSPDRPWKDASEEEQAELDRLLAEIEADFADDPEGIAVPWDEKYGKKEGDTKEGDETKKPDKED